MNPIYTGKDVSYIDTKQAQRAAEVAAVDAEKLGTSPVLLGLGRFPEAPLDKVWRQLAYGAHHDAITGSESDQVYIDLVTGWREALRPVRCGARDAALGGVRAPRIDTAGDGTRAGRRSTRSSFDRTDLVTVRRSRRPAVSAVVDDTGAERARGRRGARGHAFLAPDVPSLGWRTLPRPGSGGSADGWTDVGDRRRAG